MMPNQPGMYPAYPQYQNPMMMGSKGTKNAMKVQETNLKMALNKVCNLNFFSEKDFKKMPMMPGMVPGMMPAVMPGQQNPLMFMDKKTKKDLFKRGSQMFFSMFPQTFMMQYPQMEQFIISNKPQVSQMFQPLTMPGMMPMMPQPGMMAPMGAPTMMTSSITAPATGPVATGVTAPAQPSVGVAANAGLSTNPNAKAAITAPAMPTTLGGQVGAGITAPSQPQMPGAPGAITAPSCCAPAAGAAAPMLYGQMPGMYSAATGPFVPPQ